MPQAVAVSNTLLGIRLEGGQKKYAPGDVIIGCVFRKHPIVSPAASVAITLTGRTKTKTVIHQSNNSTRVYRSRFNLLDVHDNTERLFQGPVHIPAGGDEQTWPFAIAIPTHVDDTQLGSRIGSKDPSYLPLEPEAVVTHELPSTFTIQRHGFRTDSEAFIEYFLQAELLSYSDDSTDKFEACMPIIVRRVNPNPPIADFRPRRDKSSRFISSYHLVPGLAETELSFSQKRRQFFSSSKVPTLWFGLQIDTPTVIQLENPNQVPFVVCAAPEWNRSSDALQGVQQMANVKLLNMSIVAQTEMKCDGYFGPHHQTVEDKIEIRMLDVVLGPPISIPITDDHLHVDLGALLDLRIDRHGRVGAKFPHGTLTPTFTTYNIKHSHVFKWRIRFEISGEYFDASGSHNVTILGPSDESMGGMSTQFDGPPHETPEGIIPLSERQESWIRPPDDEPAPPSFQQVLEEDAMRNPNSNKINRELQAS